MPKEIYLAELPPDHPLRNRPLAEIGAEQYLGNSRRWKKIMPSWGIAKNSYNELGRVWIENHTWRVFVDD